MELTDYQKRDAHIVKYLEEMITKSETNIKKYPSTSLEEDVRRRAYKDILFKMTKNK